jgi:hypothetical protein
VPEPLTDEPDLHLLIDRQRGNGAIRPNGVYEFRLPRAPADVHIMSRSGVPQILKISHDRRRLGVAVQRIVVWGGRRLRVMDANDPALSDGFHGFEADHGYRWTDGNATLPASLFDGLSGACTIELTVGCTARYPLAIQSSRRRAA